MTAYDAEDRYLSHVDQPYGKRYAAIVGQRQEAMLRDKTCRDLDEAFARAVESTEQLIPVLKLTA